MGTTRALAAYVAGLNFDDLPSDVVNGARSAVVDFLTNLVCGSAFEDRKVFDRVVLRDEQAAQASLFGTGRRVSTLMAAFGNCSVSSLLDFGDGAHSANAHLYVWPAAVAVPAAFAEIERVGGSGPDLLTSVVAGYEACVRVVESMDIDSAGPGDIGGSAPSTLASTVAAGRALGLDAAGMESAIAMAGIYMPVAGVRKWLGDAGLRPRKDIKQGWGWMCLSGVFAAESAEAGLEALQENNVLDGKLGLSKMLGMEVYHEERVVQGAGKDFRMPTFNTKALPGCGDTHRAIAGARQLVQQHSLSLGDIERIEVVASRADLVGFDDPDPRRLVEMEFSAPYQVSAALVSNDDGPGWYLPPIVDDVMRQQLAARIHLDFDDECEQARSVGRHLSKVRIVTISGDCYQTSVEDERRLTTVAEVEKKFLDSTVGLIGEEQAEKLLTAVEELPQELDLSGFFALVGQACRTAHEARRLQVTGA